MAVKGYLQGLFFNCTLFFSATFGAIFFLCPSVVFLLFNKQAWFRWYNDTLGGFWLTLPGAMFELLFGTKVVIKGEPLDKKDCPLIIINHRCRLDWMFYWMYAQRNGRLQNEKIIMKHELKFLPGPGWCMQNLLYCFLQRRWEEDESYLERIVNYFIDLKYPLQFFLFPEGTDLCKESLEKSDSFAEKNNLVKYKYVLHPRVKGFNYLVQKMRKNILNTVYDVTIGFPVNLCYGEMDLVRGNFPKEVHFLFKRYEISELPTESDKLDQWCVDRWAEKEACLKAFYENGKFTGPHVNDIISKQAEEHSVIMSVFSLIFWVSFNLFCFYLCFSYTPVCIYAVVATAFCIYKSATGGVDTMQLDIHEKNKGEKKQ